MQSSTGITWRVTSISALTISSGLVAVLIVEPLGGDQLIDRTADGQVVLRVLRVLLAQNIDGLLQSLDVAFAALDELLELGESFLQQLQTGFSFGRGFHARFDGYSCRALSN